MINSLKIGKLVFPVNLIQGPLAGVSCAPFRELTWRYSQPAFSCTEMISCKTLIHQPEVAQRRFVSKSEKEGPVCFQLASDNTIELAEAVKRVTDYGADLIDLNCGCPVKKIRRKGLGSSLLTNAPKLYQLMATLKQNTHVPVAIKIRVQGHGSDKFNQDIVNAVSDAGADFLVVHGRHWTEDYSIKCHYEQIQFFVSSLKIPVIGNGDVRCVDSLKTMFNTGCAGVMISRAGVGQPWLIRKLIAEMQQTPFTMPTPAEVSAIFIEHVTQLMILLNSEKFAILQARKFAKYYARGLTHQLAFINAVNTCERLDDLKQICERYFVS